MDLGINGKVALVTGGTKGIGFAVARGLAKEGARVVVSSRTEDLVEARVSELREQGCEVFGIPADVSSPRSIAQLFDTMRTYTGLPDILVVNAGGPSRGSIESMDDSDWERAYNLTLMSAIRLANYALPHMQAQRWGRIVNITSLSVRQPVANLALSNVMRAGVTGFAKTLSQEIAAQGITVNNVAPGYTDTERLNELFKTPEQKQALAASTPMQRFGTPEEVASAALYLASQQAGYMTGQTLVVAGGAFKGVA